MDHNQIHQHMHQQHLEMHMHLQEMLQAHKRLHGKGAYAPFPKSNESAQADSFDQRWAASCAAQQAEHDAACAASGIKHAEAFASACKEMNRKHEASWAASLARQDAAFEEMKAAQAAWANETHMRLLGR